MTATPSWINEDLRTAAQDAKKRIDRKPAGDFKDFISLAGQKAEVQPGGQFWVRLLPRWDYVSRFKKGPDGKMMRDPAYQERAIFHPALSHLWQGPDGKWHFVWCPRTLDRDAPCPIREAGEEMRGSADAKEREIGKKLLCTENYLFNVAMGPAGKRLLAEDNTPLIRILPASSVIFVAIATIIRGGTADDETAELTARGDISDLAAGYDILIQRPPKDSGQRWAVTCATNPSPLYTADKKDVWGAWYKKLHDLPERMEREVKSYDDLYLEFHGRRPVGSAATPGTATREDPDDMPGADVDETASDIGAVDDPDALPFEMPDETPAPKGGTKRR